MRSPLTPSRLSRSIWLSAALFGAWAGAVMAAPAPAPYRPKAAPMTYVDDTVVVARVGDRVIRARDFIDRWFNSYVEFRPVADSTGRAEFLKRLVDKEVFAAVARSAKIEESFEDRAQLRQHVQQTLGNTLFERAVLDSVDVHQADAESIYVQMKRELHLSRIRFGSLATAQRMRRDMVAGRLSLARAWDLRLRIPGDQSVSPDVGWYNRQSVPPEVARTLFALPVGGISEPYPEPPGFSIYQVKEERPLKLQDFRVYRGVLMDQLRNERTAYYRERLVAGLRRTAEIRLDSANVAWAAARFPKRVVGEGTSRVVIDATVPVFTPEDTGRVIATFKGGKITVGRLVLNYRDIPEMLRPSLDSPEGIRDQIDVIVLEPMFAEMAKKRGYDRDSSTVALIERKREEIMVDHLFRDSIEAKVFIPPAARRKYYQENKHRFVTSPNARYASFFAASRDEADSLADQLRHGVPAAQIVRADSIAGHPRGAVVDKRKDDQNMPYPQVFGDMKEGEVQLTGPNRKGEYNVLQLISRDWGTPVPFEQADAQIDEYLRQEGSDEAFDAFVSRHARTMSIETHPELLTRIRLIEASPPGQSSAQR